jgi:hypothetical protein
MAANRARRSNLAQAQALRVVLSQARARVPQLTAAGAWPAQAQLVAPGSMVARSMVAEVRAAKPVPPAQLALPAQTAQPHLSDRP